jgi:hypothetical protein
VNSATCEWRGGATHDRTRHMGRPKEGGEVATNTKFRSSVAATEFLCSATPQNMWSSIGIFWARGSRKAASHPPFAVRVLLRSQRYEVLQCACLAMLEIRQAPAAFQNRHGSQFVCYLRPELR